jgi:hypothetical protein
MIGLHAASAADRRGWPPALVCGITLIVFAVYAKLLGGLAKSPSAAWASIGGVAIVCVLASKVSCRDLPDAVRVLLRGLVIACGLYNLLLFPDFPVIASRLGGHAEAGIRAAWCAAAVAAVLAWQRPAWLLFCAFYAFWIKQVAGWVTGFRYHTLLDVQPLYQMPAYLAIAVVVHTLLQRQQADTQKTWRAVLWVAIAMHASNYVVAGVAKVTLDGAFLEWPLHNDVTNILLVALHNKQLLWGDASRLADAVVSGLWAVQRPLAIVLLLAQLGMLAAFTHKRLMLGLFVLVDLMHIGIFAMVGANFWTWFMVNLAIIAAAARVPAAAFDWKAGLVGAALIAVAPVLIKVTPLAWYDTRAVNSLYFEVVDDAGQATRVPNTFFGFYSYPIAHMSFGLPPGAYLPTSTNGGTSMSGIRTEALQCRFSSTESPIMKRWNPEAMQRFVQAYHRQVVAKTDAGGHWSNAVYPHHFWSAPSIEQAFSQVDLRRIRHYRLVIESDCLDTTGAVSQSFYRNEFTFDIR